jgi:excisionase family DNA binding protein
MKLISVKDASEKIGCSRGHVYNLIAAGKLRRYDIALKGTRTRLSEEDVDRYITESEQPVSAA